jgi:hypothetical protein
MTEGFGPLLRTSMKDLEESNVIFGENDVKGRVVVLKVVQVCQQLFASTAGFHTTIIS